MWPPTRFSSVWLCLTRYVRGDWNSGVCEGWRDEELERTSGGKEEMGLGVEDAGFVRETREPMEKKVYQGTVGG